jgi:CheY-like chemotaxis protein
MSKKKILLVDDESGFTKLIKLALKRYDIREVNDPKLAVKTALEFRPDLIVLDVIMPDLDGGEVARLMREDVILRKIPIIFLTAIAGGRKTIDGYPFLPKPVSAADLERCIEENLAD